MIADLYEKIEKLIDIAYLLHNKEKQAKNSRAYLKSNFLKG